MGLPPYKKTVGRKRVEMDEEDKSKLDNEEEVIDDQLQEEDSQEDLQQDDEQQEDDQLEEDDKQEEEDDKSEDEQPSRREQLRINKLLEKYGDPRDRDSSTEKGINYDDLIDADEETLAKLDKTSKEYGNERYQDGVARAEYLNWTTNLKIETPVVHQRHPQMANKTIADSINNEYLKVVGYDGKSGTVRHPDLSYEEFVGARFEQAEAIAEAMTEKTRRNITRQASRTGIRPDGSSAKRMDLSKSPQEMTDDELDAYIKKQGFAPTKR